MALLEILKDEITATKEKLAILQKLQGQLTTIPSATGVISTTPPITPNQFSGQPVGTSLRQIFAILKRGASEDELRELLAQGNADLGRYPKRTAKLALVNNKRYFELRDGLWYLTAFEDDPRTTKKS